MAKNIRFLVLGKNGQVGYELRRSLALLGEVIALDRAGCDLSSEESICSAIRKHQPSIIVNPAAYTAVDKAETERELSYAINGIAPGMIGEEARKIGALVVHYSTDYVFNGSKEGRYTEDDPTDPLSVYGASKLAGEEALRASGAAHLIFRTSWVYGVYGKNFLKTMLRLMKEREELKIVSDQVGAPTSASLIADVTALVLRCIGSNPENHSDKLGLYHLTAAGETSWNGYASLISQAAAELGIDLRVVQENILPIPTSGYPVPAKRPMNSSLDCLRLESAFGIRMPQWHSEVRHALTLISDLNYD
jgi:dTDP-4-dehydrorhamnose reductase